MAKQSTDTQSPGIEGDSSNGTGISQPMREEQIQNAVNFLSHPRVRGSPVVHRRNFLENKGLTKEEIDEAFRRVPDPSPNAAATTTTTAATQGSGAQITPQNPQVVSAAAAAATTTSKNPNQSRFNLSHALLSIGVLAASGAGTAVLCKKLLIPRLKGWIRKVLEEEQQQENVKKEEREKPGLVHEATEAAKAAASAAADVAQAAQQLAISKNEERKYFEVLMDRIDAQVDEMKSIGMSLSKMEISSEIIGLRERKEESERSIQFRSESWNGANKSNPSFSSTRQLNGTNSTTESHSVRPPSSVPVSVEAAVAPHPKSYMDIIEMIQRGERPPNIKDINDMPPNPNQPIPQPRFAPRPKPWEINPPHQQSPILALQSGSDGQDPNGSDYALGSDGSKEVVFEV